MADKEAQQHLDSLVQQLETALANVPQSTAAKATGAGGSTVSTSCCTHSCPCAV
jgi:hypothetical protein